MHRRDLLFHPGKVVELFLKDLEGGFDASYHLPPIVVKDSAIVTNDDYGDFEIEGEGTCYSDAPGVECNADDKCEPSSESTCYAITFPKRSESLQEAYDVAKADCTNRLNQVCKDSGDFLYNMRKEACLKDSIKVNLVDNGNGGYCEDDGVIPDPNSVGSICKRCKPQENKAIDSCGLFSCTIETQEVKRDDLQQYTIISYHDEYSSNCIDVSPTGVPIIKSPASITKSDR